MIPVVSFVGPHNAGKTTLLEKVIAGLKGRGFRVGVIKHAFHPVVFEEGKKDSLRLFEAGAAVMTVVSNQLSIEYRRQEEGIDLRYILEKMATGLDIVLVEGFKNEDLPKIQILRSEVLRQPMQLDQTIAVAADFDIAGIDVPVFPLDPADELIGFLVEYFLSRDRFQEENPKRG